MREFTNSPVVFAILIVILFAAAVCIVNFIYEVWRAKRRLKKPKIEKPENENGSWGDLYKKAYTNHK